MTKPCLLVAEDDRELRSAVVGALQDEGYDVLGVPNGAEALKSIRDDRRRPDLVVLDLEMPVLSGWDFLAIRQGDPVLLLIPLVVISAESEIPPEIGPSAFVRKPIELSRLCEVVSRALEASSPDPERLPRRSEPWSADEKDPRVVKNSFGQAVAYVASEREARRVVAAVNGASRISTEALEQGIIDKGLECLYQLNLYDTDESYRGEIDAHSGVTSILTRRKEIAAILGKMAFAKSG